MSQYDELKRLAAEQCISSDLGMFEDHQLCENILALIAENERLQREEKNDAIAYKAAIERQNELRAEVAGLKTGYQAYERVNAELKAENEALRKDAERYQWMSIEGNWVARFHGKWRAHVGEYGDANPTDWYPSRAEAIDAAMGKGSQS